MSRKDFLSRIFEDRNGEIIVGQKPNTVIILAFVFLLFGVVDFIPGSHEALLFLAGFFFLIWSGLEILTGVNYFRKILGVFCMLLLVFCVVIYFGGISI